MSSSLCELTIMRLSFLLEQLVRLPDMGMAPLASSVSATRRSWHHHRRSASYRHHPASSPNRCVPVSGYRACSASLGLLQQRAVWSAHFTDPASSFCTECHCAAHIRFTAFRAHLSSAHQPSLAAHPWAHLLQIGSFNISSYSWRWTELTFNSMI